MHRRALIFLLLPVWLFAALTFDSNYNKEVKIVRSFDIPAAFLNDTELQKIIAEKRKRYENHHFFKSLDEAYLFIPLIKQILSQSTVPSEFLFLAMAESDFSLKAYSNKRASGLWQFMPVTGRLYGLKIDQYVDERRDLVKSTRAAVTYLEALHERFGKWYLAALAYNCGQGRLAGAIRRAGTDDIAVLLDERKRYLPAESRRYIRKIIALTLLASDEDFLIHKEYAYMLNRANSYSIATIRVDRGERVSRVAKLLQMPSHALRALNRHLNYDFIPPYAKSYELYIPYVKLSEFRQSYTPPRSYQVQHVVSRGETLSHIGKRYGISYRVIKAFNDLTSNHLRIGQRLMIPIDKPAGGPVYTVQAGDTLGGIARNFNLSIAQIKAFNGLNSDVIRIGDQLKLDD